MADTRKRKPRKAQAERKTWTPEELQQAMDMVHRLAGLPEPTPEYMFARDIKRYWRIDRAYVDLRIALEIEGGIYHGGRHIRPEGFKRDMVKYNELAIRGWILIRATYDMLPTPDLTRDSAVLPLLQRAIAYRQSQAA